MNTQEKLEASERCKLFERIAKETWDRIIRAHDVSVDLYEEGITRDILVEILQFSKNNVSNFDVYAKKGKNENTYGSDIDIYVETITGKYKRYALQAKILKKNKRYTTLLDGYSGDNPTYQWEKLMKLKDEEKRKNKVVNTFYLLYNGMEREEGCTFKEEDSCNRTYDESQLGCSLVKIEKIEEFTLKKSPNGNFVTPTYDDIHPKNSDPWRTIVCCKHDCNEGEGNGLYSEEEIEKDIENYDKLGDKDIDEDKIDPEKEFLEEEKKEEEALSWNPMFKIVIKRSDNIETK